ncbi:MAG: hypothetical protein HDR06_03465 [Lachnospiraceae bacterium]|nr:hypothetical protein [Lachnospiraceae bacterium]
MNKKYIKLILAFILSCSIAYLIGQKVVLPLTDKKNVQQSEQKEQRDNQQDEQIDGEVYDLIRHFPELSLTGQSTVDDNPWDSNLTTFEDEEHGTCILMVPGTAISAQYRLQGEETLSWNANIHPWMAKISDGVGLDITVKTVGTDVPGITEQIKIVPTDTYEQGSISLAEFQDTEVQITLSVNNGDNDDSSGDWLVFDQLVIQPSAD